MEYLLAQSLALHGTVSELTQQAETPRMPEHEEGSNNDIGVGFVGIAILAAVLVYLLIQR